MKIVEINTVFNGSTGKLMLSLADICKFKGHDVFCFATSPHKKVTANCYSVGNNLSSLLHSRLSYLFKNPEMNSFLATKAMIKKIEKISPDIIHIHNLHGFYLCLPLLFKYIKKTNKRVVWTLHDCWGFTGRCPHFLLMNCYKWKNGCFKCPYKKTDYPPALFDVSQKMWKRKRKWFTGINNLTIVTPSFWMASLVKESFLKEYEVKTINNGINLEIFKPTENLFKRKIKAENKFIVLGISFNWSIKKGLDVFVELSKKLTKDFVVVLVGTNEEVDRLLPPSIVSIHKTQDQKELAEIYSSANVFVNPTREDNFPTVNLEALACGTPVLTFDTGGCSETIDDNCGKVLKTNSVEELKTEILNIYNSSTIFKKNNCLKKANEFNAKTKLLEYVQLYEEKIRREHE